MSHFTVMVIGENPEKQLKPFQENNMDDCPDEYLKFNDVTEEYLKEYENDGVEMVESPSGERFYTWDKRFKHGKVLDKKTVIPDNYKKVNVLHKERYKTFDEFMTDWAGYEKNEETSKYGYFENPNAKWDWYQLGGRWTGILKLKEVKSNALFGKIKGIDFEKGEIEQFMDMAENNPEKFNKIISKYNGKTEEIRKMISDFLDSKNKKYYPKHIIGEPGIMTELAEKGYCDQCLKKNIDIEGARSESALKAKKEYEFVEKVCNGIIPKIEKSWQSLTDDETLEWDERRKLYHSQDSLAKFKEFKKISHDSNNFTKEEKSKINWLNLSDYQISKEKYIEDAENNSLSTFAVIKDGKWYEKGEMGWWACVSNEKDKESWNKEFTKLFDSLPEDELISIYDCHI